MRRKLTAALLLLMTALSLTGCWDRAELEEESFVLAIGLDKGKSALYSATFVIALPEKMAGGKGGGGEGKPFMLTTVEAPTVAGAIGMVNTYLDREVTIQHTKALFMGEELAQQSGMYAMDEFVRFRQARRSTFYIVTKGKAKDFLDKIQPKMEKDPQRFIEKMSYNYRATGMIPASSQIQNFVTTVNTGYISPVTYYAAVKEEDQKKDTEKAASSGSLSESGFKAGELPREGGPNMELLGGAAFRGEKMVGVLTGEDMRMVLLLQDQFQRGFFSIQDPEKTDLYLSLDVRKGRPAKIDVDLSGGKPKITATITLEAELTSMQSDIDYTDPAMQVRLEEATALAVKDRLDKTIKKTQDWGTDVVGFGRSVVKQFPTVDAWEAYGWPDKYKDADVTTHVRVTIRRFGKQLSPPKAAR
jgi:Ger(x)C family germination protein